MVKKGFEEEQHVQLKSVGVCLDDDDDVVGSCVCLCK